MCRGHCVDSLRVATPVSAASASCTLHAHSTLRQDEPTQPYGTAPAALSRGPGTFQAQTAVKANGVLLIISK